MIVWSSIGLAQVIINILHEGLPVGAAVDAPRLDVQLGTDQGDEINYEGKNVPNEDYAKIFIILCKELIKHCC